MSRRTLTAIAALSLLSLGGFLLSSHLYLRIGFPLDDAWIHQSYARNLAMRGEWAVIPGQPSGGSTGPLWGAMLALGYVLGIGPYIWTFALGWLILWVLGVFGVLIFPHLCSDRKGWAFWAGVLLMLEWHLVWAAASGMETLLFGLFVTIVLGCLVVIGERAKQSEGASGRWTWLGLGTLIGLSVWLRPDGVTLMAPAGLLVFTQHGPWRGRVRAMIMLGVGFAVLFGPYLIFNRQLIGAWWPTTFYAKQAEYAFLQSIPLWRRWLDQGVLPLIGVGSLLSFGFLLYVGSAIKRHRWSVLIPVLWMFGYMLLYALRLPVTYQHGRYMIPMMPAFFLWGFAGLAKFVHLNADNMLVRVLNRTWLMTTTALLLAFWWVGARAYARDVAVIESEMVAIAHWINQNTPPDAVIATHDIGALGYFTERQLLDLAGLISPEVIPYLWDGEHLEDYLDTQGADYLVTFPGWFPTLTAARPPIFQTEAPYSRELGGENMAVYHWRFP